MAKISLEKFTEEFNNLSNNEKIAIYNEYCLEHGDSDKMLYDFDEEFFEMAFEGKEAIEICKATFFGNIESWGDDYIRFNAYGNLETVSDYDARIEAEEHIEDIYDYEDVWEDYIEPEEEDEEEEEDDDEDEGTYICPECGHVFRKGEWNYNYDTAHLDFECPECNWQGNEEGVNLKDEEGEED